MYHVTNIDYFCYIVYICLGLLGFAYCAFLCPVLVLTQYICTRRLAAFPCLHSYLVLVLLALASSTFMPIVELSILLYLVRFPKGDPPAQPTSPEISGARLWYARRARAVEISPFSGEVPRKIGFR